MNDHSHEPTIRGDQLLEALRFMENYSAKMAHAHGFLGPSLPTGVLSHLFIDELPRISHPFGFWAWMGQIAIRYPLRRTLETSTDSALPHINVLIADASKNAVDAACNPEPYNGLGKEDRHALVEALKRFLLARACEDITTQELKRGAQM